MRWVISTFLIIASTVGATISAQSEAKDQRDAVLMAKKIARQMQQTQDIKPILKQYASPRFIDVAREEYYFNVFALMDEDLVKKLDPKTAEAYYIAATNWLYLALIYSCSESKGEEDVDFIFPPDIKKFMVGRPVLTNFLKSEGELPKPKTPDEIKKLIPDLLRISVIYRKYLRSFKTLSFKRYLTVSNLATLSTDWKFFKPEVGTCEYHCLDIPKGFRTVSMPVPGFLYAEFSRIKTRMMLTHIYMFPGD